MKFSKIWKASDPLNWITKILDLWHLGNLHICCKHGKIHWAKPSRFSRLSKVLRKFSREYKDLNKHFWPRQYKVFPRKLKWGWNCEHLVLWNFPIYGMPQKFVCLEFCFLTNNCDLWALVTIYIPVAYLQWSLVEHMPRQLSVYLMLY